METAANFAERYAAMSDIELAELVSGNLDSLNEEARSAFQAELRTRHLTLEKLREQYPSEPLAIDDESNSRISLLKGFGFLGIPLVGFLALALYFALDKPFRLQCAISVGYTGFVFFNLFSDVRSSIGYDLREKAVRQKMPHLLAVHAVFLAVVFTGLTVALWLRPSLPPSWLLQRGRKDVSWFDLSLMLIGYVTFFLQIHICRKILGRSVGADRAT